MSARGSVSFLRLPKTKAKTESSKPKTKTDEPKKKPEPPAPLKPVGDRSPDEVWNDYFSKRQPKKQDVAQVILKFHNAKKHYQVIAIIGAALRHGQGQRWMYDVLALSMKVVGRPQADINRVLSSSLDLAGGANIDNMLQGAAHFVRFRGYDLALQIYRQASRLDPTRSEPYILGLKHAQRQKNYDAIRWATTGILTTAWLGDYSRLHQQAIAAADDAYQALVKSKQLKKAKEFRQAVQAAQQRDLILKLSWNGSGDLDLFVEEPLGTVCSGSHRRTVNGGCFLHDGIGTPEGKGQQKTVSEEYVCALGMPGKYRVRIRRQHYGKIVGDRAVLTVTRGWGTPHQSVRVFSVRIPQDATAPQKMTEKIVRLSLLKGRRTAAAKILKKKTSDKTDGQAGSKKDGK